MPRRSPSLAPECRLKASLRALSRAHASDYIAMLDYIMETPEHED